MITRHNTDNKEEVARKEKVHVVEFFSVRAEIIPEYSPLHPRQTLSLYYESRSWSVELCSCWMAVWPGFRLEIKSES